MALARVSRCHPPPGPANLVPGAILPILKKAEATPAPRQKNPSHMGQFYGFSQMWVLLGSTNNWDLKWELPQSLGRVVIPFLGESLVQWRLSRRKSTQLVTTQNEVP